MDGAIYCIGRDPGISAILARLDRQAGAAISRPGPAASVPPQGAALSIARDLEHAAGRMGGEPRLFAPGAAWSYAQAFDAARRLAGFLSRSGVRPGDVVSSLEWNTLSHYVAYHASALLGFILNPLNTRIGGAELARSLALARSRHVLAAPEFARNLAEARMHGAPPRSVLWLDEAPAESPWPGAPEAVLGEALLAGPADPRETPGEAVLDLYTTSGTTGRPKGVPLSHRNVDEHARAAVAELGLSSSDSWAHIAPLFHLADAWAVFAVTKVAGRQSFLPRFAPGAALGHLQEHGTTITNLVPTMLALMAEEPGFPPASKFSLRLLLSGGAPMAPALVARLHRLFGSPYVQTYGMTETSPYLTLSILPAGLEARPLEERLAWAARTGRPFRGVELRVVDDDGHDVPVDGRTVGEIQVRGPSVMRAYWHAPLETLEAFDRGWLRTGDLAVRHEYGFVDIVDRKKDVVISGGEKVYSVEVESVLLSHPLVIEAAVVGRPHPAWGEAVTACVVLRPGSGVPASELIAHCRQQLSPYKVPKSIEFLDTLPRTASGKIHKAALRSPGS